MSMFSTKNQGEEGTIDHADGQPAATVIAHGVKVEGDFVSQGDVLIEGEVLGRVSVTGVLTVGARARLKADVSAEKAVVAGDIQGNLKAKSHVELKATAKMVGDVTCATIAVEAGATLHGKVAIGSEPPSAKGASKPEASASSDKTPRS